MSFNYLNTFALVQKVFFLFSYLNYSKRRKAIANWDMSPPLRLALKLLRHRQYFLVFVTAFASAGFREWVCFCKNGNRALIHSIAVHFVFLNTKILLIKKITKTSITNHCFWSLRENSCQIFWVINTVIQFDRKSFILVLLLLLLEYISKFLKWEMYNYSVVWSVFPLDIMACLCKD